MPVTVHAPPSSENLLVGKGSVFFNRFDANGLPTGWKHMGNIEKLEASLADTKLQKFSSMVHGAPLYKEVLTKRIVTLALTGDEFHPDALALGVTGSVSTLVQAATPVVAEVGPLTTVPGTYFTLNQAGPASAIVVTFGITVGVLGTDYEITTNGIGVLIHILPGSAMTGAITTSYTPTAYTSTTGPQVVSAGALSRIEGALKFYGDPTTGPAYNVDVWHVSVEPSGAIGLISDDFATMSLNMEVFDDSQNHPASPLWQLIKTN